MNSPWPPNTHYRYYAPQTVQQGPSFSTPFAAQLLFNGTPINCPNAYNPAPPAPQPQPQPPCQGFGGGLPRGQSTSVGVGGGLSNFQPPATLTSPFVPGPQQATNSATEQIKNVAGAPKSASDAIPKSSPNVTGFLKPDSNASAVKFAKINLLRGPGVEVVVGAQPDTWSANKSREVWFLSKALISHYSPTLKDVCDRSCHEADEMRVVLNEEDPCIFQLFLQWMLYGAYAPETTDLVSSHPGVSLEAQAWVLGHKLRSTDFKNYAMNRLYDQYATNFAPRPVTTADIRYAFEQSNADSRLRQIFLDLFAAHFRNKSRIQGETEEWDAVMQDHPELRMHFLIGLRSGPDEPRLQFQKKTYMDVDAVAPSTSVTAVKAEQVVPAKRNADGVPVKKEPAAR